MFLHTEVVFLVVVFRTGQCRARHCPPPTLQILRYAWTLHQLHPSHRPLLQNSLDMETLLVEDVEPLQMVDWAEAHKEGTEEIEDRLGVSVIQ